jgi:hypothetical protein
MEKFEERVFGYRFAAFVVWRARSAVWGLGCRFAPFLVFGLGLRGRFAAFMVFGLGLRGRFAAFMVCGFWFVVAALRRLWFLVWGSAAWVYAYILNPGWYCCKVDLK